jgi:hypothetical protein
MVTFYYVVIYLAPIYIVLIALTAWHCRFVSAWELIGREIESGQGIGWYF